MLLIAFLLNAAVASTCGTIVDAQGQVEVLRKNAGGSQDDERQIVPVKVPQELRCDDVIVTRKASRAKIKFPSSLITMSSNSRIFVGMMVPKAQVRGGFDLTYGDARAFVEPTKKDDGKKFLIRTPTAVAGVRGTDLFVGFDPNTNITTQATLTGKVEVTELKTNTTTDVPQGHEAEVKPKAEKVEVKKIEEETVEKIKAASVLAKTEEVFQSSEAIQIVGKPETWTPPESEVPENLKDVENKF